MSVNKGVAAAQRRRTAPQEQQQQQRGPQPSINSSQMFAKQGQQQQQQQQQQQEGISGISKMTIPQAITLITLRLGQIETRIQQLYKMQYEQTSQTEYSIEGNENMLLVDKEVIHSITQRLSDIENESSNNEPSADIQSLKQHVDVIKQGLAQFKNSIATLVKDAKEAKQNITVITRDVKTTKTQIAELHAELLGVTKQMLTISLGTSGDDDVMDDSSDDAEQESSDINESSLKTMIEAELK